MLRQSEIRSAAVSNGAGIAIANRTVHLANFRHRRRRIRIGPSVMLFGHEASAVIASMRPSPLLVWTWETILRIPDTKHARSRLSQLNPIILFVSVTPGTHWKKNATSTRSGFAPNPPLTRKILLNLIEIQGTNFTRSECCNRDQADRHSASPVSPRMYPQMRAVESLRI